MADITSFPIHTTELANVGQLQDASQFSFLGIENTSVVQTDLGIVNYQLCNGTTESDEISNVLCIADDSSDVYQTDPKDVVNMGFTNGARPTWMASPINFVLGNNSGYVAANGSQTFDLIGDSSGGVKAVLFALGANQNNLAIIMLNTSSSAALTQTTFCNGSTPVTVTKNSSDGNTAHCTFTNNGTVSYLLFLVFRGSVVLT